MTEQEIHKSPHPQPSGWEHGFPFDAIATDGYRLEVDEQRVLQLGKTIETARQELLEELRGKVKKLKGWKGLQTAVWETMKPHILSLLSDHQERGKKEII